MQSRNAPCLLAAFILLILGCSDRQDASPSAQPDIGESRIGEPDISGNNDADEVKDAEEVKDADEVKAVNLPDEHAPAVEWTGITVTEAELKAEPAREAPNLTLLAAGTFVTVRERRGGWYRVAAPNSSGWLRMLAVARDDRELKTATDIATGRSGSGNVVNTTGIRGFNAQELARAEPDWEALAQLDSLALTRTQAAAAAGALGLKARAIRYLPRPKQ
jgi:hypothetical protein